MEKEATEQGLDEKRLLKRVKEREGETITNTIYTSSALTLLRTEALFRTYTVEAKHKEEKQQQPVAKNLPTK